MYSTWKNSVPRHYTQWLTSSSSVRLFPSGGFPLCRCALWPLFYKQSKTFLCTVDPCVCALIFTEHGDTLFLFRLHFWGVNSHAMLCWLCDLNSQWNCTLGIWAVPKEDAQFSKDLECRTMQNVWIWKGIQAMNHGFLLGSLHRWIYPKHLMFRSFGWRKLVKRFSRSHWIPLFSL